jgi:phosphomannomutase/phosphoglucomutase
MADLLKRPKFLRPMKAVVSCGNGTAGAFVPRVLSELGIEVIPLNCELDYTFPAHNPNPEDLGMLDATRDAVLAHKADLGLAFDGDGDRCGVVDNEGEAIFADKVGVMLARDIAARNPGALFVADVKSTGLFLTDPVLKQHGAKTTFWKTGHSYIKRYSHETGALVGFEKSGHFFFNPPLGRGYDDGLVAALAVLDMLDRNPSKTLAELKRELPQTWQSPTMSPHCDDEKKYGVVDRVVKHFEKVAANGGELAGQKIRELITVNGIRIVLEDGTWGLVRASSNKPELVVVVESPTPRQTCGRSSPRSTSNSPSSRRWANIIRRFRRPAPPQNRQLPVANLQNESACLPARHDRFRSCQYRLRSRFRRRRHARSLAAAHLSGSPLPHLADPRARKLAEPDLLGIVPRRHGAHLRRRAVGLE